MSDMLLGKQGVDPEVVSLANEIKNAQGPEIEQMQGWLRDWGVSSSTTAPAPPQCPVMTCLAIKCPAETWVICRV